MRKFWHIVEERSGCQIKSSNVHVEAESNLVEESKDRNDTDPTNYSETTCLSTRILFIYLSIFETELWFKHSFWVGKVMNMSWQLIIEFKIIVIHRPVVIKMTTYSRFLFVGSFLPENNWLQSLQVYHLHRTSLLTSPCWNVSNGNVKYDIHLQEILYNLLLMYVYDSISKCLKCFLNIFVN